MRMQDMRAKLGQQLATGEREGLRPGMQPADVDPEQFAGLSFSLARRTPAGLRLDLHVFACMHAAKPVCMHMALTCKIWLRHCVS